MYNKLFTKILDSSIWLEDDPTRLVWITLIAAMDEEGFAQFASVKNIARRAVVSDESAEKAILKLESPDPDSSDPDHKGRRIERVPGGWMVLNAPKYRDIVTRFASKEANRLRVARHREKKRNVMECNDMSQNGNGRVMESDTDTDTDTNTKSYKSLSPSKMEHREINFSESFLKWWNVYPKKTGKIAAYNSWRKMKLEPHFEKLLAALEAQKISSKWLEEGGRFIPNPQTWLNQGRWEDEVLVVKSYKEKFLEETNAK